ncbi:UNKNOWN [Stylonychia lemnae]|uniref:GAF domain-containing protein n=1 Tax=Stylonychia lemnae TaxID=5949 RepID=A0A078ASN3_STYLE|nr:UNKNOWN [Stylonychia lemnae]|eukprot:CDW85184.1 UNKNOWN [Stylonychia lemnae]
MNEQSQIYQNEPIIKKEIPRDNSTDTLENFDKIMPPTLSSIKKKHLSFDNTRQLSAEKKLKMKSQMLATPSQMLNGGNDDEDSISILHQSLTGLSKDQISIEVKQKLKAANISSIFRNTYIANQSKIEDTRNYDQNYAGKLNQSFQSLQNIQDLSQKDKIQKTKQFQDLKSRGLYNSIDLGRQQKSVNGGKKIDLLNQQNNGSATFGGQVDLNQEEGVYLTQEFKKDLVEISSPKNKGTGIQTLSGTAPHFNKQQSISKNYHNLSQQQLIKLIETQTAEIKMFKDIILKQEAKIKTLKVKKRDYQQTNKELLQEIMKNDDDDENLEREETERSQDKRMKSKAFSSPGKIHQIYQDFFITDMKKDLSKVMDMMTTQKSNANTALIKLSELRKKNHDLTNKLKRYRQMMNENLRQQQTIVQKKTGGASNGNRQNSAQNSQQDKSKVTDDEHSKNNEKMPVDKNLENISKLAISTLMRRNSLSPERGQQQQRKSQVLNMNDVIKELVERQSFEKEKLNTFSQYVKKLLDANTVYQVIDCMNTKDFVCALIYNPKEQQNFSDQPTTKERSKPFGLVQMQFQRTQGMNGLIQLSFVEEFFVKTLAQMIGEKLRLIRAQIEAQRRRDEIIQINTLKSTLSEFFGFESASVMFRNEESTELFTTVTQTPDPIFDRQDDFINYPSKVGLTGYVVKSQLDNDSLMDTFNQEQESITVTKDLKKAVGPRLSVVKKGNQSKVIKIEAKKKDRLLGVIQFINKSDRSAINEFDIEKAQIMNDVSSTLFGMRRILKAKGKDSSGMVTAKENNEDEQK